MNYPNTFLFWSAEEGLTLISAWARQGLSENELARRMGVRAATLARWRLKSPAMDAALLRGRAWADAAVEQSLLKKALGFTVTEVCEEESSAGIKTKTCEKYIPPDLSAQLAWLRLRCPERWGEKTTSATGGVIKEIIEAVKQVE